MSERWDARTAAARGAVWEDEHEAGWIEAIDTDRLDLSDCEACIRGQLDGEYHVGTEKWGLSLDDSTRLGFNVTFELLCRAADDDPQPKDRAFAELTAAWLEEIAQRRLANITREVVTA